MESSTPVTKMPDQWQIDVERSLHCSKRHHVASRELAVRNWQGPVWQGHVWNTVLAIILWLVWFYG
jgi:hypothetical protein